MPPGTLFRRALRRHDRRVNAWREARDSGCAGVELLRLWDLMVEAARLSNRLAYAAGIDTDPRHAPRFRP